MRFYGLYSLPASAPSPAAAPAAPRPPVSTSTVVLDAQEMHELAALAETPQSSLRSSILLARESWTARCSGWTFASSAIRGALSVWAGPTERHFALVEPSSAAEANPHKEGVEALARLVRAVVETHKAKGGGAMSLEALPFRTLRPCDAIAATMVPRATSDGAPFSSPTCEIFSRYKLSQGGRG